MKQLLDRPPKDSDAMVTLDFFERKMAGEHIVNKFKEILSEILYENKDKSPFILEIGTCSLGLAEKPEDLYPAYLMQITLNTGKIYGIYFPVNESGLIFTVHTSVEKGIAMSERVLH